MDFSFTDSRFMGSRFKDFSSIDFNFAEFDFIYFSFTDFSSTGFRYRGISRGPKGRERYWFKIRKIKITNKILTNLARQILSNYVLLDHFSLQGGTKKHNLRT